MSNKKRIRKLVKKLQSKELKFKVFSEHTIGYNFKWPGRNYGKTEYINRFKSIYSDRKNFEREYLQNPDPYSDEEGIIEKIGCSFNGLPVFTSYLKERGILYEIDFVKDNKSFMVLDSRRVNLQLKQFFS